MDDFIVIIMLLSIITINYNNAEGLRKTLASVASQTYPHIEHIIVDGGSTDNSLEVIREYESSFASRLCGVPENARGDLGCSSPLASRLKWLSEKDTGIYNAMNKGIRIATGEYCQFLNSGDMLAADDVTERMVNAINAHQCKVKSVECKGADNEVKGERLEAEGTKNGKADTPASTPYTLHSTPAEAYRHENRPAIFYGNMLKVVPNGKILYDASNGENEVTLDMFYQGCLNHSSAYIKRALFDKYGMYDENLRICSDWKFYMQSIVLGGEKVQYVDIDMTLFDMTGISETNKDLLNNERNQLLNEMVPVGILRDYDNYHFAVDQYKRLKKHHLWGLVYFVERVLFKLEKWNILR